jgi:DnaK suppressor protein
VPDRDEWDEADARGDTRPVARFIRTPSGWQPVPSLSDDAVRQVRALLDARAAQLAGDLGALAKLERPRDEGPRPQYGKRIGDHTSDALETRRNVAAADTLRLQEVEVRRALAKLDEGNYGCCDRCGGAIGAERLEALPWAAECVDCRGRR